MPANPALPETTLSQAAIKFQGLIASPADGLLRRYFPLVAAQFATLFLLLRFEYPALLLLPAPRNAKTRRKNEP